MSQKRHERAQAQRREAQIASYDLINRLNRPFRNRHPLPGEPASNDKSVKTRHHLPQLLRHLMDRLFIPSVKGNTVRSGGWRFIQRPLQINRHNLASSRNELLHDIAADPAARPDDRDI
jgi:hypothetical protein